LLGRSFEKIFGSGIDEDVLEEVEEALLTADVGVQTSLSLVEMLREQGAKKSGPELRKILRKELRSLLEDDQPLEIGDNRPHVIVMIGVNGSGKTTTIGKLAHRLIQDGKTVMMAAGDTFRAGAIDQLRIWAERTGAEFISSAPGSDPASVIYNALEAAKVKNVDVLLCDTAGRLQAQQALMEELGKVMRVCKKVIPDAPHETLLVLDATIGQNALSQAKGFMKVAPISGVVLTKLDGTAKGGIVLAVKKELGIPVKLVGLGEGLDDLHDFQADLFIEALLPEGEE
jgi:fused signal recognition particle receptor